MSSHKKYLVDSLWPTTSWLGFDHDTTCLYSIATFADYPLLRGWTAEEIGNFLEVGEIRPGRSLLDMLGMFQSWLFFGLIEDLLQCNVASSEFVVTTSSKEEDPEDSREISRLHRYLETRCQHIAEYMSATVGQEFRRISGARWQANFVQQRLCKLPLETRLQPAELRAYHLIMLQLRLADEAAMFLRIGLGVYLESERTTWTQGWLFLPKACPPKSILVLEQRAVIQGWCRAMIRELSLLGLDVLHYAITFGTPNEVGRGSHSECTDTVCVAYNIDPRRYKPAHYLNCPCRDNQTLQAPVETLYSIIERGEIPLVASSWPLKLETLGDFETFQVQYVSFTEGMRFVAFSHVWSDGHGGTPEDGFPICQAIPLTDIAARCLDHDNAENRQAPQSKTVYFWIDSLCVPKRSKLDSETMSLRDRAIWSIRTVFESASVTVVMDRHLYSEQGLDLSNESTEQQLLRLICGKWNHRVWTLHEGSVSSNIVVLTKGGTMKPIDDYIDIPPASAILWKLSQTLRRSLRTRPAQLFDRLGSLGFRSTSRPEDAVLAMAPLLGLPIEPILREEDYERRMEVFWLSLPKVSSSLIWTFGPKLSRKGFRWANKYLMRFRDDHVLAPPAEEGDHDSLRDPLHETDLMAARCTERGLETVLWVWEFGGTRRHYHSAAFPSFYEERSSHLLWIPGQAPLPQTSHLEEEEAETVSSLDGNFDDFNALVFLTLPDPDRALTSHWWVNAACVMATGVYDATKRMEIKMVANLRLYCKRIPQLDGDSEVIRPTAREVLVT